MVVQKKYFMHEKMEKKNMKCGVTAPVFRSVALQCRQVKITILGEEGVPVQVDGEAWIQPPGIVKIVHKNRAQMLTRDRVMTNTCIEFLLRNAPFFKILQLKNPLALVQLSSLPMLLNLCQCFPNQIHTHFVCSLFNH